MKFLRLVSIILVVLITQSTILEDITQLRNDLYSSYWKNDVKYKQFQTWDHLKGLFPSDIHFNFVDGKNSARTAFLR